MNEVFTSTTSKDALFLSIEVKEKIVNNSAVVRDIYQITIESEENKRRFWLSTYSRYPSSVLSSSRGMLQMFVGLLKKLKNIANNHASEFNSNGFLHRLFEFIRAAETLGGAGLFSFTRAERKAGGKRTFRLIEGEPLQTSHGKDLYEKIFEAPLESRAPDPLQIQSANP